MEASFLDYSMSVITQRALPDVRDGLKPVHRRILWAMFQEGFRPDRPHVKCARVTGHVMGKYHPHGDSAIYDALVRMAQPFSLRHPLIDFHGNYGSPDFEAGGGALHRVPAVAAGHAAAGRHRRGHRRLRRQLLGRVPRARRCCPPGSPTCWSTAARASPWAWPPTSRPTTWPRSSTRSCTSSTTPTPRPTTSWRSSRAPTSPPAPTSWAGPASWTPTAPAAAPSGCGPGPRSTRARPPTRSSSPSCPTR